MRVDEEHLRTERRRGGGREREREREQYANGGVRLGVVLCVCVCVFVRMCKSMRSLGVVNVHHGKQLVDARVKVFSRLKVWQESSSISARLERLLQFQAWSGYVCKCVSSSSSSNLSMASCMSETFLFLFLLILCAC